MSDWTFWRYKTSRIGSGVWTMPSKKAGWIWVRQVNQMSYIGVDLSTTTFVCCPIEDLEDKAELTDEVPTEYDRLPRGFLS